MARALPGVLGSASPDEAGWVGGYTSPSDIAKKMFREREFINSKTKLTWNDDKPPLAPTDRMVGEVNLSLPYMRIGTRVPGKVYYIQNAKWYLSNGSPTTIEDLAVREANDPEILNTIYKAEEIFLNDASRRDDALCKICLHYRAKNYEDYTKHILAEHPDHAAQLAGINIENPIESEPKPVIDRSVDCRGCGKTFKDKRGLAGHARFSKTCSGA